MAFGFLILLQREQPTPTYSPSDSSAHFSEHYQASLANVMCTEEHVSYSQAQQYPEWVEVMNKELTALEISETVKLGSLLLYLLIFSLSDQNWSTRPNIILIRV